MCPLALATSRVQCSGDEDEGNQNTQAVAVLVTITTRSVTYWQPVVDGGGGLKRVHDLLLGNRKNISFCATVQTTTTTTTTATTTATATSQSPA